MSAADPAAALAMIDGIYNLSTTFAVSMSSKFIPAGKTLLFSLTIILLALEGIKYMLSASPVNEILAKIVRIMLTWGLAFWFLSDFAVVWIKGFVSSFEWMALEMSGKPTSSTLRAGFSTMLSAAQTIWQAGNYEFGPTDIVTNGSKVFAAVLAVPFKFAIVALLLANACIYAGVIILSKVTTAFALCMGPLCIPWLLLPQTTAFFHGWLRTLAGASLVQVVATYFLLFASESVKYLDQALAYVATAPANGAIDIVGFGMVLFVTAILTMMMWQAPAIAASFLSGGGGGGHLDKPTTPNLKAPSADKAAGGDKK